jgi:hypothetical protein
MDRVWTYHAWCGDGRAPQETGWVLVIEGSETPFEPQALSVADVIDDLDSMMPGERTTREAVTAFTDGMIQQLERQAEAAGSEDEAAAFAARAAELREELEVGRKPPAA